MHESNFCCCLRVMGARPGGGGVRCRKGRRSQAAAPLTGCSRERQDRPPLPGQILDYAPVGSKQILHAETYLLRPGGVSGRRYTLTTPSVRMAIREPSAERASPAMVSIYCLLPLRT